MFPFKLLSLLVPTLALSAGITTGAFADSDPSGAIEAFKHSWTAKALHLQSQIDENTPLNQATFIGTHNSYNSKAYEIPFVRYADPNHTLSIYDQLEMGVRSIEIDAHWTLDDHFSKDILLCHGRPDHVGCGVFDRPIYQGLEEVRAWLKANPNEVVLLYIERHLDGHEPRMAALLEQYLGDFLYRPTEVRSPTDDPKSCVSIPSTLTKADVLKAGKQIMVVVKGCDGTNPNYEETSTYPQIWNDTTFAGIGNISTAPFSFIDAMIGEITPYPDCGKSTSFSGDVGHTSLWRVYEDRTMLTHMIHPGPQLDANDMQQLEQCNVNWPSMDMLTVNDARLTAAIWSWAPSYPQDGNGNCAVYKSGVGIVNAPCEQIVTGFACQEKATQNFKVINANDNWASGESICQNVAGNAWHFVTPINGTQMRYIKEAISSNNMNSNNITAVWLNYATDDTGRWTANIQH